MQVFHYLADQLKHTPIFDRSQADLSQNDEGAIYNDFDNDPMDLLDDQNESSFSFSQCQSDISIEEPEEAPEEAVRSVIMSAEHAGPSNSVERSSDISSKEYLTLVYKLAILDDDAWAYLRITPQSLKAYQIRYENEWSGKDVVYDAWLLSQDKTRLVFPYEKFHEMFPDYQQKKEWWQAATEKLQNHEYMSISKFRKKAKILNGVSTSSDEDSE